MAVECQRPSISAMNASLVLEHSAAHADAGGTRLRRARLGSIPYRRSDSSGVTGTTFGRRRDHPGSQWQWSYIIDCQDEQGDTMTAGSDDTFELDGAVCVVTGATRGIGRVTARTLGAAGAHVVIVGRSTRERPDSFAPGTLEEVEAELAEQDVPVLAVQADLTDPAQVDLVIERTFEWRGRCDVLVNNAAYTSNGSILKVPPRRWQTGFQMQVATPLQLCQAFVPGMLERHNGRVLNVGTRAAREFDRQPAALRHDQSCCRADDALVGLRARRPRSFLQCVPH